MHLLPQFVAESVRPCRVVLADEANNGAQVINGKRAPNNAPRTHLASAGSAASSVSSTFIACAFETLGRESLIAA